MIKLPLNVFRYWFLDLERQALIDRENEILLDKLARIIRRKPEFTNAPRPPHHKSNPLSDRRERQTKEIFKANEVRPSTITEPKRKHHPAFSCRCYES
jgi:hypothetical protein